MRSGDPLYPPTSQSPAQSQSAHFFACRLQNPIEKRAYPAGKEHLPGTETVW
jgi:hypothetical protein